MWQHGSATEYVRLPIDFHGETVAGSSVSRSRKSEIWLQIAARNAKGLCFRFNDGDWLETRDCEPL